VIVVNEIILYFAAIYDRIRNDGNRPLKEVPGLQVFPSRRLFQEAAAEDRIGSDSI
jgi:hypothetical protein